MNIIISIFLYLAIIITLHHTYLHFQSKYTKPIIHHNTNQSVFVSQPEIDDTDLLAMDDDLVKLLDQEMSDHT